MEDGSEVLPSGLQVTGVLAQTEDYQSPVPVKLEKEDFHPLIVTASWMHLLLLRTWIRKSENRRYIISFISLMCFGMDYFATEQSGKHYVLFMLCTLRSRVGIRSDTTLELSKIE